jgi:2-iminobutanoate/2-iminopropanoate deaminase
MANPAVSTPDAPAAIGPYSQGFVAGGLLFASGQVHLNPAGEMVQGDVKVKAARCLDNLAAVAQAAGVSLANAVKLTVFLADMNDFAAVNEVYASRFQEPYPARSAVQVAGLPKGADIEIEAIFALPEK